MTDWLRRHVWMTSVLIGVGCVLVMLVSIILITLIAPEAENTRWVGREAAPAAKTLAVLGWELAFSAVTTALIETLVLFALPALPFRGFSAPGWLYAVAIGGPGWLIHGAGIHQIPHGLNFGIVALWYWAVQDWRGSGRAILATALAHAVWNAILMILWFVR